MTKTQNTVLFLILGTLANIIVTIMLIVLFTVLAGFVLKENIGPALPVIFILAVVAGMVIYQKTTKFIIAKYNLEDKMTPLFGSKKKSR